jgi:hypothetical protein
MRVSKPFDYGLRLEIEIYQIMPETSVSMKIGRYFSAGKSTHFLSLFVVSKNKDFIRRDQQESIKAKLQLTEIVNQLLSNFKDIAFGTRSRFSDCFY